MLTTLSVSFFFEGVAFSPAHTRKNTKNPTLHRTLPSSTDELRAFNSKTCAGPGLGPGAGAASHEADVAKGSWTWLPRMRIERPAWAAAQLLIIAVATFIDQGFPTRCAVAVLLMRPMASLIEKVAFPAPTFASLVFLRCLSLPLHLFHATAAAQVVNLLSAGAGRSTPALVLVARRGVKP